MVNLWIFYSEFLPTQIPVVPTNVQNLLSITNVILPTSEISTYEVDLMLENHAENGTKRHPLLQAENYFKIRI